MDIIIEMKSEWQWVQRELDVEFAAESPVNDVPDVGEWPTSLRTLSLAVGLLKTKLINKTQHYNVDLVKDKDELK